MALLIKYAKKVIFEGQLFWPDSVQTFYMLPIVEMELQWTLSGLWAPTNKRFKEATTDELCHGKTCIKIFVVVIPKEGLAGEAPTTEYNL